MIPPPPLTRHDALVCWREFLPKVADYASVRNHVRPDHGNVSRLSAAVRFRLLSEDEVIAETLAKFSFPAAEKWLQEVWWRRYWKGWLEQRPGVWTQWRRRVALLRQTLPAEILTRVRAVETGASGVSCMDAMARELTETGYLHNHARMWWASFWIHVERLPWELGADFFFRHLLDADPASNTLSWRWVAGLQTPGKNYLVRLSNIEKYAPHYLIGNGSGCHRIADGTVTPAPVEASADPGINPQLQPPPYPVTLAETAGRTGLWLHPDDLLPEAGPLAGLAPVSIAGCVSDRRYRDTYQLSAGRIDSLHRVLGDGLTRASAHFKCPSVTIETDDPVQGLADWAVQQDLAEVVAFAPMVGPIHDLMPSLTRRLGSMGIRLTLLRRPSDAFAFPLAGAGFFPFWQKMSQHLKAVHDSSSIQARREQWD